MPSSLSVCLEMAFPQLEMEGSMPFSFIRRASQLRMHNTLTALSEMVLTTSESFSYRAGVSDALMLTEPIVLLLSMCLTAH